MDWDRNFRQQGTSSGMQSSSIRAPQTSHHGSGGHQNRGRNPQAQRRAAGGPFSQVTGVSSTFVGVRNTSSLYTPIVPQQQQSQSSGRQGSSSTRGSRNHNQHRNNTRLEHAVSVGSLNNDSDASGGSSRHGGGNWQRNSDQQHPQKKKFDGPVFGFKRLFNFLTTHAADEVITSIHRDLKDWEELLQQDSIACNRSLRSGREEMSDDTLVLIVSLLGEKVCSDTTVLSSNQTNIISSSLASKNLKDKVREKCERFVEMNGVQPRRPKEFEVDHSPHRFLRNILKFYQFVATKMKTTAVDHLPSWFIGTFTTVSYLSMNAESPEITALCTSFKDLKLVLDALKKEFERKNQIEEIKTRRIKYGLTPAEEEELHGIAPPDDFRDIPIIPTVEELQSQREETFLRPNKRSGAYQDADHYLDVQFRLLREDYVRPLKDGIQDYIRNKSVICQRNDYLAKKKRPPIGNIRIYPKVRYSEFKLDRGTMIHYVQLHEDSYKRVKWDKSKRLLNGSMLVFTANDFEEAYFAVVHQRDDKALAKGRLAITWEGLQPEFNTDVQFLMVECEVYFEAYRHTLQILKEIPLESFPLAKFIVEASSDVRPPAYLLDNRNQFQIGNYSCSPLHPASWPSAENLRFDHKQYDAFQACLTKEFAIVQGPPGTGKTFLALQVVRVLLRNPQVWKTTNQGGEEPDVQSDVGPILVVCYTNHALDQFLEGILKVFQELELKPNMIRVGGRCKSATLDEFSLARQRLVAAKMYTDRGYSRMKGEAYNALRQAEGNRNCLMGELAGLNSCDGIPDLSKLSVRKELDDEIPGELWPCIKTPSWLGLDLVSQKMSIENRMQQWFTIRQQQVPAVNKPNVQRPPPRPTAGSPPPDDGSDDDEDYDLEELQENRIIDEIYMEAEAKSSEQTLNSAPCIFDEKKKDLQYEISKLRQKRVEVEATEKPGVWKREQYQEIDSSTKQFQTEVDLIDRKNALFSAIFSAYKSKTIVLPDVSILFAPEHEFSLERLPIPYKWAIFFQAWEKAKTRTAFAVKEANEKLKAAQKSLQEVLKYGDGKLLAKSSIVGMTTTGAAKYNDLLRMAKSRIVIVEEAAEVLESHIVTCITASCQHLILIGDHQQLRPSTTVYDLAKKYYLDISLFERMVENRLNCYKINVQHRMRPEIANLVVGTIYPELYNAPNVKLYPPVAGVLSNLYFIDHKHAEASESDSKSKSNEHEAKYLSAFCRYLVQNGYAPTQITILTTYTGQMFLIKQCIRKLNTCQGVRVTCVDNFQGEENDIILLSLVRSNENGNIGFLKTDNRICVALSRAKHGLFVIGNMTQLVANSKTWKQIREKLELRSEIGTKLTLECKNHSTVTEVERPVDFERLCPEGGCLNPCEAALLCGHVCRSVCHIEDSDHQLYKCKERCEKTCVRRHQCQVECSRNCPPCPVAVNKDLDCGHTTRVQCHKFNDPVTCYVPVEKELPCGHRETLACYVHPSDYKCKERVQKTLPCSHVKEAECHEDSGKITCGVMVDKGLACGHTQLEKCWKKEETIKCDTVVEVLFKQCQHKITMKCHIARTKEHKCKDKCNVRLECGHACTLVCHTDPGEDPEHLQYTCKKNCARLCGNAEHRCTSKHECWKPCPPCKVTVKRPLPCGHEHEMKCHESPKEFNCKSPCSRVHPCGHKCESLCNVKPCPPCQVEVEKKSAYCGHTQVLKCSTAYTDSVCEFKVRPISASKCRHDTMVPCRLRRSLTPEDCLKYCDHPCGFLFRKENNGCGHRCKGSCKTCMPTKIHIKCLEKCGKTLVCGHVCDFPCSQSCPPCQKKCELSCDHSKCMAACGEPCTDCGEPCTWSCPHKRCTKLCSDLCDRDPCELPCPKKLPCGHDCIGFCGEPCPPQCRICDTEELTDFILYGYEEDEDARFVLMEDCGHAIEQTGLEYHMNHEIQQGEIVAKSCPRCKTLIRRSRRYGNILKGRLKDVMQVKRMKFGMTKELEKEQTSLITKVWDNKYAEIHFPLIRMILLGRLGKRQVNQNGRTEFVKKKIDALTLSSVNTISNHLEEATSLLDSSNPNAALLKQDCQTAMKSRLENLFDMITNRQLPLSSQEVMDFDREFDRLFDLHQVYQRMSSPKFTIGHARGTPIYFKIMNIMNGLELYTQKRKDEIRVLLKELDQVLSTGLGISERERKEILAAMNMREGRWFKCPNGHVYVITECGGAMVESKCNECGARIGGGNHTLRADNALATEMDGATQPLWPTMLHR